MSTSYYLVCDEHKEVVTTSYHCAMPPLSGLPSLKCLSAFCYRHCGCALRVVSEHQSEPWSYADSYTWWRELDDSGDIPFAVDDPLGFGPKNE